MEKETIRALKLFGREDLTDGTYDSPELDSNIEVFMTPRQMIYYMSLEAQLKKQKEIIDKLSKNENSNNFLKDSLKLQIEMNKLFKKHNVTMEDLRNLCIPFRDKYNFTDHQTLRIAREEVSKEELLQILEDKEV